MTQGRMIARVEVFVASDPHDSELAARLTADLRRAGAAVRFTCWTGERESETPWINPPGSAPRFLDASGRPLITDENAIKRAV